MIQPEVYDQLSYRMWLRTERDERDGWDVEDEEMIQVSPLHVSDEDEEEIYP